MSNNFRKTAVLKKIGGVPVLKFLQRLALDFHIFVCNFPRTFLQTNVKKILESGSRSSSACNGLKFFQVKP